MKLKAMTCNTQHCLNYVTRKIDYPVMAEAIKTCAPDIVALNEMRGKGVADGYDAQVDILAKMTDMQGYFAEAIRFEGKNPYGNGLLSKFPILSAEVIGIPVPEVRPYKGYYEDRCLLKAVLDVHGERLTVLVIHVGLNPDEAERAVRFFNDNYNRNISVESYAKQHHVSVCWFIKSFTQLTRLTPMQYIISVRIANAKSLLSDTNQSVSQIASAVGYDNSLYFSRIFKKHTGLTPSQYRHSATDGAYAQKE